MAELLVRVVDKVNLDDPKADAKCTKRGFVICVQPDGWPWGTSEIANPEWRIVRVPGVDPADLTMLTTPEVDVDPLNPSQYLQRRAFKLDLEHVGVGAAGLRPFFDEHTLSPVAAKGGKTLPEVVESEQVTSNIEEVIIQKDVDGNVVGVETVVWQESHTVEKYPVDQLDPVVAAKLAGLNVEKVEELVRDQVVADCDVVLIGAITAALKPIADPGAIGDSPIIL